MGTWNPWRKSLNTSQVAADSAYSAMCALLCTARSALHTFTWKSRPRKLRILDKRRISQRNSCAVAVVVALLWLALPLVASLTTGIPKAPDNLNLIGIYTTAAVFTWDVRYAERISSLEMTVRTRRDQEVHQVLPLAGSTRGYTVRGLSSGEEYQIYLVAFAMDHRTASNASEVITFRTLSATSSVGYAEINGNPGEYILVILVLSAWVAAVVMFLNKWRSIRILQPSEPRYRHNPKNLDTITVVKEASDSVIYRSYTHSLSQTMVAREKKIMQRMHTMPNIKVETGGDLLKKKDNASPEEEKKPEQNQNGECPGSRDEPVASTSRATLPVIKADDMGEEGEASQPTCVTKM